MEHMGNLGIISKNSQKSYPRNNPRMKTIIKQSCRKRKKLHQEVPRHHNFTIFTSQLCVLPRRHPRPPRFVAQEANSASFRAGFRRRLAGTCRFSDFGRSLFSINIYGNLWEKSRFMIDQWEIYGKNLWTSMEIYENLWKQSRFW